MAKKGQKFNNYNSDLKKIILEKYLNGQSSKSLENEYGISCNTIQTWGKKAKWPEKYQKSCTRGRPKEKNLTLEDWKERYEVLKKYQAFLKAQREKK